jgi:3'(2'), 5'-bisphosphate nucleotidase
MTSEFNVAYWEELIIHAFRRAVSKSDRTPVSLADFAGQALLTAAIHRAFPADDIVGEEVADTLRHDAKMRVRG